MAISSDRTLLPHSRSFYLRIYGADRSSVLLRSQLSEAPGVLLVNKLPVMYSEGERGHND